MTKSSKNTNQTALSVNLSQVASYIMKAGKEMETKIKKYLLGLGFQPNLKGYRLLAKLIGYAFDGKDVLPLKYAGYAWLANDFGVDSASVEKDIQNAISAAWLRGDVDTLYREFGETLDENKGKPTNKQFVLTALERIK